MSDEVKKVRKLLAEGGYTCVAVKNGSTCFSTERGVRPLLEWLEQPEAPLREAAVADKVIGKAAALLMVYAGVREVYAAVSSEPAACVFRSHGIPYKAGGLVPRIVNRRKDGLCPMESRVMDIDSPEEAYHCLKAAAAPPSAG